MLDGFELLVADVDVFGDGTLVVQDSDDVLCSLNDDIGGGAVGDFSALREEFDSVRVAFASCPSDVASVAAIVLHCGPDVPAVNSMCIPGGTL